MRYEQALQLVYDAIDAVNPQLPQARRLAKSPATIIVGPSGSLDSLGIVNLLVAITALPGAETRTSPYGPVVGALAAGAPGPEWAAVVWTRPEAIVESFARAMAYDQADPQQALEETRAYAAAIATFARGARAT